MSRKSRYEINTTNIYKEQEWKIGIYVRLSNEDNDDEISESIKSQIELVKDYCQNELLQNDYKIYIDDGYTGVNTERPGFINLKNDFEQGKINCIIVKDLSRLVRNEAIASKLIYVIFPLYKIRLISILDKIDTFLNPKSVENIVIPIKNIMNEEYLHDISIKRRMSNTARMNAGEWVGAFCVYGYKKDPNDKHKLIVDEIAAKNVRYIFDRFIECKSYLKIAEELTLKNVLTPYYYKKQNNSKIFLPRKSKLNIWSSTSVKHILENETYTGSIVQGKSFCTSYKNKKRNFLPKEQWIIIKNKHEPIIESSIYNNAQSIITIINQKNKSKKEEETKSILSKKVFCGKCGLKMAFRSKNKHNSDYRIFCIHNKFEKSYNKNKIYESTLKKIILTLLNNIYCELNDYEKLLQPYIANTENKSIENKKSEISKQKKQIIDLYESYKNNFITLDDYDRLKQEIVKHCSLEKIENISNEKNVMQILKKIKNKVKIKKLTLELVNSLIDKIVIYDAEKVEITFLFNEEFESIKKYVNDLPA